MRRYNNDDDINELDVNLAAHKSKSIHSNPFNTQQGTSLRGPPPNQSNFSEHNIPNESFNQYTWDQRLIHNMQDNRGPLLRPSGYNNFGQDDSFNQQAPRSNFMNGRMQDTRQGGNNMNQQFGNYEHNNYGRRGRGTSGGHGGAMRGRGRGFY